MAVNFNVMFCRHPCRVSDFLRFQRRFKHKTTHWSVIAKRKSPKDKALEHFDDFYKSIYGKQWPSIRIGLLSPHKYCAVINNFGDTETTVEDLQNQGAINIRRLFEIEAERIKAKKSETTKRRRLERVFEMDRKMEKDISSKQEQLASSNQVGDHTGAKNADSAYDKERHQIDNLRIIDPSIGLSAGALQEFVPATQLKGLDDYVPESQHYNYYKDASDFPVVIKSEESLNFPKYLNVFTFERGNVMPFPEPKTGSTGVLNYFLLNGSSLLPILALGVEPGDAVLDMCAAPGGKSYMILQTLHPKYLVCNDIQHSRVRRIKSMFKQYLYDFEKWEKQIIITEGDGSAIGEEDLYDKILVDVPCTTDRHSVTENDNNIFKPTRVKERLRLPELQAKLLSNALRMVRVGGSVVYATCSLSPIQNDGVVHMALRKIWEETKVQVEIRDLTSALDSARSIFRFSHRNGSRYGHLVLPFLPSNFGPLYFCKFMRTA
ncbi:5-methylcytosine rRNA methyltransferase NSUN4 [Schistocerca americana]|uniref:5-methylcytosine rRNA methyltransferase NSUN4 n=1 Tax=Schistocerca americana TaxID=7009 RepID=UPI001F4FB83C|nr:5-methylcytosine rRNA methyltransferase NSUN4 [Schistocerca americana]